MRAASLIALFLLSASAAAAPTPLAGRWYIGRDTTNVVIVAPLDAGRVSLASPGHWDGVALLDDAGFWGVFRYLDAEPDARLRPSMGTHRARLGLDGRLRVDGRFMFPGGRPFWSTWSPAGMPPPEPERVSDAAEGDEYEGDGPAAGPEPAPAEALPAWGEKVATDEEPVALVEQQPEYPREARARGVQGTVTVRALVDGRGVVREARVVKSIPVLDEAAVRAVRGWRFRPALRHGRPVSCWLDVPVRFRLH